MRNTTKTTMLQASPAANSGDSVNQVTLIGRLVATPELRKTASGKLVTTVRIATNDKSHAEFHDVVLWGQLADFACQYLGKGRLVYIEGRLHADSGDFVHAVRSFRTPQSEAAERPTLSRVQPLSITSFA